MVAESTQIETRIELTVRDLKRRYEKAMKKIAVLKKKINDLELSLSQEDCTQTEVDMEKLIALTARLDKLVDSVISGSVRAGQICEQLKQECRAQAFGPAKLEDLEATRRETEQLAKDLLCYSLGHFRNTSHAAK